jgi:two-component system NtrC family response regulator
VEYFLGRFSQGGRMPRLTDRAMQCLMVYDWPGNIREMQNVLERSMILSEGDIITEGALPMELVKPGPDSLADGPCHSLQEMERRHILTVLELAKGSRTRAAEILGIGRKTLYRKLRRIEE